MPTAKTMHASVRVALRLVQQCQTEVLQAVERGSVQARRHQEQFRNALRQALSRWIEGSNYALFKERMHIHAPDVCSVLESYEQELLSAEKNTKGLSASEVDALRRHEKREQEIALTGMRRAIIGVRNNYLHVEDALRQVYKHRLAKPALPPEEDPRAWLAIVDMAMAMLKEPEMKVGFWERLRKETNQIHAVARKIEQRTKEGCPTMLRHLNESLEIYAKNQEAFQASKSKIDALQSDVLHHKHVTRYQELQNMGYVGYLIAHLPDRNSLQILVQQLDALEGHQFLEELFNMQLVSSDTEDVSRRVQLVFPEWEHHLQDLQVHLRARDSDNTDYSNDPVSPMCDDISRLCNNINTWLSNVESSFTVDSILQGIDDADNVLNLGVQTFFEHPLSVSK